MLSEPKKRGRKVGSKNKFPSHGKMQDEFLRHNFDFIKEWVGLYREAECDLKGKLLISTQDFLYAKRRPEDESGKPEEKTGVDPDLLLQLASLREKK